MFDLVPSAIGPPLAGAGRRPGRHGGRPSCVDGRWRPGRWSARLARVDGGRDLRPGAGVLAPGFEAQRYSEPAARGSVRSGPRRTCDEERVFATSHAVRVVRDAPGLTVRLLPPRRPMPAP